MTDISTLKVPGMTCGHCVQTLERAARSVPGVSDARVDLASKTLAFRGSAEARAGVVEAIARIGYRVEA